MPEPKFSIFLSYSTEELIIARSLREQLMLFDVDNIDVFHDAANIRSGSNWRELLVTKLKVSQWLIAVHTGDQRIAHSFPGWEVGVFESENEESNDSRIFCLYDTEKTPELFSEKQNRKIKVPLTRPAEQGDYYTKTELGAFLDDFVDAYRRLIPAEMRKDELALEQRKRQAAAAITMSFWKSQQKDIQEQAFPQYRIKIRVEHGFDTRVDSPCIPDTAAVTTSSSTNAAIGLESRYDEAQNLKQYSWGELRRKLGDEEGASVDWMDHINEVIVGYLREDSKGLERVSFRTRDNKVFRAVLSRVVRYKSGAQEFEMELIESFPRTFRGDDRTSRLLIGLIFASRFRFAFLEHSADSYASRLSSARGPLFAAAARQIVRDIDRMEQESSEFGLTRPELLIEDFGPSHEEAVKLFFAQWAKEKKQLYAAVVGLGQGQDSEANVRRAFEEFREGLTGVNDEFIRLSLDAYRKALGT